MTRCRAFRRISILFALLWWSHLCLEALWRTHVVIVHSTSLYWPITCSMVWGALGYAARSPLIRNENTLNNDRYVFAVLRLVVLSFIRALQNAALQQDKARPHVADTIRTFLETGMFGSAWSWLFFVFIQLFKILLPLQFSFITLQMSLCSGNKIFNNVNSKRIF